MPRRRRGGVAGSVSTKRFNDGRQTMAVWSSPAAICYAGNHRGLQNRSNRAKVAAVVTSTGLGVRMRYVSLSGFLLVSWLALSGHYSFGLVAAGVLGRSPVCWPRCVADCRP